jgi:hypothetical protein
MKNNKRGQMNEPFKWILWAIFAIIAILGLGYIIIKLGLFK